MQTPTIDAHHLHKIYAAAKCAGAFMILSETLRSNVIAEYLDSIGLPWLVPRSDLTKRFGVRPHPAYGWNVIEIETPGSFVDGLLWPLSVRTSPQFSEHMPATEYSGITHWSENAYENFSRTKIQLEAVFGQAQESENLNSVKCKWESGSASVELQAFPPERQQGNTSNPAHWRDNRLKTGCYVSVKTGFRMQANEYEKSLFEKFRPIARVTNSENKIPPNDILIHPAKQTELEFIRFPEYFFSNCYGHIGCSEDKSMLFFSRTNSTLFQ